MSRNAQQIRQEIEQTRSQLAQNLEAIGDRVSPKHVVEQISEKVSPRRLINRQTEKVRGGLHSVTDSVRDKATDAVGAARSTADGVRSTAGDAGGRAASAAASATDEVKGQATNLGDRVRTAPDANPMATALVAFGAGLVVGLALPPSDKERQAAGTVRGQVVEPLRQQAVQAGRSVAGELQPAARSKAQRVKRTATTAADRVKQEAKGAAADVQGQAGRAATSVKRQAQQAARATTSDVKATATTTARRTSTRARPRAAASA